MTSIVYKKTGALGGQPESEVLYQVIQVMNKKLASASDDLTNNSGGTADTSAYALEEIPSVTAYESAGTDLVQKAACETALGTVKNAFATLYAKANALATVLGIPTVAYSGGGTDGTGTVAAVTKSFSAVSSSGVAAAGLNTILSTYAVVFMDLGTFVNKLCTATGVAPLDLSGLGATYDASVIGSALSTATGTASTTVSVEDSDGEAAFTAMANNVSTIAAKINLITNDTVVSTVYTA